MLVHGFNPSPEPSLLSLLVNAARLSRLGIGLILVGWIHCLLFAVCEYLYREGDRVSFHYLTFWLLDVIFAGVILIRRLPHLDGGGSHGWGRVSLRVWLTFLLLCLTSASLNTITGFQIDWFKISWALLGTFAFATMAWIFHIFLLLPAIQMSLTALLIAAYPDHSYLIFGVSWLLVLNGLGLALERHQLTQFWISLFARRPELVSKRDSS